MPLLTTISTWEAWTGMIKSSPTTIRLGKLSSGTKRLYSTRLIWLLAIHIQCTRNLYNRPRFGFVDSWSGTCSHQMLKYLLVCRMSTGSMQGLWLVTLGGQQRALHWMHTTVWRVHQKGKPLKKCVVCTAKGVRKETRYCCETCSSKPALCIIPCFELFDTVRN